MLILYNKHSIQQKWHIKTTNNNPNKNDTTTTATNNSNNNNNNINLGFVFVNSNKKSNTEMRWFTSAHLEQGITRTVGERAYDETSSTDSRGAQHHGLRTRVEGKENGGGREKTTSRTRNDKLHTRNSGVQ